MQALVRCGGRSRKKIRMGRGAVEAPARRSGREGVGWGILVRLVGWQMRSLHACGGAVALLLWPPTTLGITSHFFIYLVHPPDSSSPLRLLYLHTIHPTCTSACVPLFAWIFTRVLVRVDSYFHAFFFFSVYHTSFDRLHTIDWCGPKPLDTWQSLARLLLTWFRDWDVEMAVCSGLLSSSLSNAVLVGDSLPFFISFPWQPSSSDALSKSDIPIKPAFCKVSLPKNDELTLAFLDSCMFCVCLLTGNLWKVQRQISGRSAIQFTVPLTLDLRLRCRNARVCSRSRCI